MVITSKIMIAMASIIACMVVSIPHSLLVHSVRVCIAMRGLLFLQVIYGFCRIVIIKALDRDWRKYVKIIRLGNHSL
jgi:hypothetical protein